MAWILQNTLLLAYGVTGSGKTHTVQGPSDDPGVLPRILDCMFNSIANQQSESLVRGTFPPTH